MDRDSVSSKSRERNKERNRKALEPFGSFSDGKQLRAGCTTGTCAAAAAQAALLMLLTGNAPEAAEVRTPAGPVLYLEPEAVSRAEDGMSASASVRKDAGDDPDVTDGILITAEVRFTDEIPPMKDTGIKKDGDTKEDEDIKDYRDIKDYGDIREDGCFIRIMGGKGIGTVTKPGLDQPPGEAAINSVPRKMIRESLLAVLRDAGAEGSPASEPLQKGARLLTVTISAPEGESIAAKTFNPRLGIRGGISILGTEGIVRPMSRSALTDTIRADMRLHAAEGRPVIAVPGNYGLHFLESNYGISAADPVIMSNFVGETLDAAAECSAKGLILAGHLGKFVKLAGGIMNTHSREADCRMELLASHALLCGADRDTALRILQCAVTEEAAEILNRAGLLSTVSASLLRAAEDKVRRRAGSSLPVGLILYTLEQGVLAESANVRELLRQRNI